MFKQGKRKYLEQDAQVSWELKNPEIVGDGSTKTLYRYYHFFKKGELEDIIMDASDYIYKTENVTLKIINGGYERDNWYAEFEVNR